jgi:hypothetical protein
MGARFKFSHYGSSPHVAFDLQETSDRNDKIGFIQKTFEVVSKMFGVSPKTLTKSFKINFARYSTKANMQALPPF